MNIYNDTYLPDILNGISQGLLVPAIAAILALLVLTLFFLGQAITEYFTERRHFKANMPAIINQINDAAYGDITRVVVDTQLLKYQKAALVTVSQNMGLPEEPLFSLAQSEVHKLEDRYRRRLAWTDTISKIGPMLGLMGTLIPLGPGIVALGQNDVVVLSQSLLLAFDATVCGLACAVASLIVSRIRSGWYTQYINGAESLVSCILDKAQQARCDGVQLPANYVGDPLEDLVPVKPEADAEGGEVQAEAAQDGAAKADGEGEAAEAVEASGDVEAVEVGGDAEDVEAEDRAQDEKEGR